MAAVVLQDFAPKAAIVNPFLKPLIQSLLPAPFKPSAAAVARVGPKDIAEKGGLLRGSVGSHYAASVFFGQLSSAYFGSDFQPFLNRFSSPQPQ
jgi:hypothetical protein